MPFEVRSTWIAIALCATAATMGGCTTDQPASALADRVETSPAMPLANERDPVLDLLDYAAQLRQATPEARARAVSLAREEVDNRADAHSYAHLALAFGTPGQRRYTPDEAARYAQRALSADNAHWSPAAVQYLSDLARLYTQSVSNTAGGDPATDIGAAPASANKPLSPSAQDPGSQQRAHIRELERELHDARRKLRELAEIETRLGESTP